MQKLVTIYLNDIVYNEGKVMVRPHPEKHGSVEEHLQNYLDEGWRVSAITGIGGVGESMASGWLAVVLEKQ